MPARGNPRTAQLDHAINTQMATSSIAHRNLHQFYMKQERRPVKVSPMYAPYFGNTMHVMLNGITVFVRCDGQVQNLPRDFADEVESRMAHIDVQLARQHRASDIQHNAETSPGELTLF